jgi:primosomal protein N'
VAKALIAKSGEAQDQAADKFKEIAQVISEQATLTQQQATSRFRTAISFLDAKSLDARQQLISLPGKLFKPVPSCPSCGKKAPQGAAFCAYCGKPMTS